MTVIAWERISTFVKLQCILDIFIILLSLYYEEIPRQEMHILLKFGQDIQNIKGFTKMGFTVSSNIWIVIIW